MNRFRQQRWAGQLALFGLLWRVGMGILFAPMLTVAANASGVATDSLQTIVICTSRGLQQIAIDEDGNPVDGDQAPKHCPICMAMAGVGVALAADPVVLYIPASRSRAYACLRQEVAFWLLAHSVRNRSPPRFI